MTYTDRLATLQRRARAARSQLDKIDGEVSALQRDETSLRHEIETLTLDSDTLEKANALLLSVSEDKQEQTQDQIERLVTRGLQLVFDSSLTFHIVASIRGKSSVIDFVVRTTYDAQIVETPVMDSRGGGLAAVVGFLLRFVVIMLSRGPRSSNLIVLDETFAHVSEEYLAPMGQFLKEMVEKSGMQVIMVTHQPQFMEYADKIYKFSSIRGATKVEEA